MNEEVDDVKNELSRRLKQIRLEEKIKTGNYLSKEDITLVLSILREKDQEVSPLLEIIESCLMKAEYEFVEESIIKILKFYNVIDGNSLFDCRHKYFFNDSKLVKKQFFNSASVDSIRFELEQNNIIEKIQ